MGFFKDKVKEEEKERTYIMFCNVFEVEFDYCN